MTPKRLAELLRIVHRMQTKIYAVSMTIDEMTTDMDMVVDGIIRECGVDPEADGAYDTFFRLKDAAGIGVGHDEPERFERLVTSLLALARDKSPDGSDAFRFRRGPGEWVPMTGSLPPLPK